MKKIIALVAIMLLTESSIAIAKPPSIQQIIQRYQAYLNAGDTPSIMALYSKAPIFMPQHSFAQVGRAAVKKAYNAVFATIDLDIEFTTYEIEITGKTAWARTSSAGKTTLLANGMTIDEGNNELFIFIKENGDWKIHRYLFSTTTPRQ